MDRLLADIRQSEGFSATPYRCPAGKLTIGYGTNIEEISREEAELLLRYRLGVVIKEVHNRWPWVDGLSERRKESLYDMAYNMGVPKLAGFKKMFAALENGDWAEASAQALDSLWAKQVGKRAQRIAAVLREG